MQTTPARPTGRELRERLGLSKGYAYDLASGREKPSLEVAARIEREFGFPAAAWVELPPAEQAA